MISFYIDDERREEVVTWCFVSFEDNSPSYLRRWTWFPFYNIKGTQCSRFDVFNSDDIVAFKLMWSDRIVEQENRQGHK